MNNTQFYKIEHLNVRTYFKLKKCDAIEFNLLADSFIK